MNKNRFIILVIMMVLSLTGIIWVQTVWISNAVSIRNEAFNWAVFNSLGNAANELESKREMNFFFNDPLFSGSQQASDISGYMSVGSYSSEDGRNFSYSVQARQ